jgi:Concanavalin A-like lectin/glucanases superfamily
MRMSTFAWLLAITVGVSIVGAPARAAPAVTDAIGAAAAVEVTSMTTQTSRTVANPDGSFTSEFSDGPVRVRRGASWVPVDPTLSVGSDGVVRPAAVAARIELSGGGPGGSLARIERDGQAFSLGWGSALPAPTLSGDTATYPEVLPGVDVRVQVGADAFSEELVVKTAAAAQNPALRSVLFPTRVTGGAVRPDAAGGFSVVGADGQDVFTSPEPLMWDSTGARVSAVPLTVGAESVTVTPNEQMLADPATRFPVVIDPAVYSSPSRQGWAMVDAAYPTQEYWKWSNGSDDRGQGVGYSTSDGYHKKRLFFQFDTHWMNPKIIKAATFRSFETFSYSCSDASIQAWETGQVSPTSTNWSNQPVWRTLQDSATVSYGRDGCEPGGNWVSFDVVRALRASQARGGTYTTLGLIAGSETSLAGWKRFKYNATLTVTYNTRPNVPTSVQTTSPSTSCMTGASRPAIPGADPPTLSAKITDADSAKGQTVRGQFEILSIGHTVKYFGANTAYKLSGGTYTVNAPTLADGSYAWRVQGYDGVDEGGWAPWCEFTIDSTVPSPPGVQTVPEAGYCTVDAVPADTNADAPCGVGVSSKFRFTTPDTSVTRYRWSLNAQVPTSAFVAKTSPDFALTLPAFGPTVVRVWSYDAAGNVSAPGALEFRVSGATTSGWWRLDETTGPLADSSGEGRPLTGTGLTASVPGRWSPEATGQAPPLSDSTDRAIALDGATGYAVTAAPVLAPGQNWTVSAWVRLDAAVTSRRYLLSQDRGSSSWLGGLFVDPQDATHEDGRWGFAVNDGTRSRAVASEVNMVPGEWTHLIGVYAPGTHEMALYVDGQLDQILDDTTVPVQTTAVATGPFCVGALRSTTVQYWWPGTVDEVRTFAGAYDDVQSYGLFRASRP